MNTCTAHAIDRRLDSEYDEQKPLTYTKLAQALCALRNTGIDPKLFEEMNKRDKLRMLREINAR